jgi:hypothetical protein
MKENMPEHTHNNHGGEQPGYETRDTNAKSVLWFAATLFLVIVASMLSMRGLFDVYSKTQTLGPGATPFGNARTLPPEPRLQVHPVADLNQMRESQNEILNSYGWVDRANGTVRIPIDRAMEMLLQRGLPTRANAPSQTTGASEAASKPKEQSR